MIQTLPCMTVDGQLITIEGEKNVLEVARKAGIQIPTFCYHSELSVYGACRLCLVDIEGQGIVTSCSTAPQPGMVVRTNTAEIREIRKINLELLLANHDQACPTCARNTTCQLQKLARRMGIDQVRFKPVNQPKPIDTSSPSLIRDPNKCILCGDCMRMCAEVQGIGAIDFAHRGTQAIVQPAFGKQLGQVECVHCGQCARVCPTGAIVPRPEIEQVWKQLDDPNKVVVAQIAPAVRVAIGEYFNHAPGEIATGQIVAALKALGVDHVYDTSFAADLTVLEEANEFLQRFTEKKNLPQFTSCCPAWVRYAEQYFPEMLPNLSSCKSPQQMFGRLAKQILPEQFGIEPENLVVVSIMPCTAKKAEAKLEKFSLNGIPEVDHVLTTQELGWMIEQAGLDFNQLQPSSLDMPFGFKTGAGVIFGNSGGVSEAVLRYAAEKLEHLRHSNFVFEQVRGDESVREAQVEVAGETLRIAICSGLKAAGELARQARDGQSPYHLIEVMACPGGCIGGAGQPISTDPDFRQKRKKGLYNADQMLQLHCSQDNHYLDQVVQQHLGEIGGETSHHWLHTDYQHQRRIADQDINLVGNRDDRQIEISVCVGTNCHLRGATDILRALIAYSEEQGLLHRVNIQATFCLERCDRGPNVRVGSKIIEHCTFEKAVEALQAALSEQSLVDV